MILSFIMALLMGLTGSLHCAGMCGPIALIMPFQALTGFKRWLGIFLYHFGRVSVYAILGLVLFSFKSLFTPQLQQYISIALGTVLLVAGLLSFLSLSGLRLASPLSGFVTRQLGRFAGNPSLPALLLTGVLNGMLPCGLVYMALTVSVTADTAIDSMLLMYAFGFGTMPALVLLAVLKTRLRFLTGFRFRRLVL